MGILEGGYGVENFRGGGSKIALTLHHIQGKKTGAPQHDTRDTYHQTPSTKKTNRGLRISSNTTSDDLNPQETTEQANREVGEDGAGLSCPGSSVVADSENQ